MDFLDEYDDSRPRLVFQSRPQPSSSSSSNLTTTTTTLLENLKHNKPLLITSITLSLLFLSLSFLTFSSNLLLKSLSLWLSLSLFVGPFAPLSITGGDVRVGQGEVVKFPPEKGVEGEDEGGEGESRRKVAGRRNKGKRFDLDGVSASGYVGFVGDGVKVGSFDVEGGKGGEKIGALRGEEREWSEEDVGLLRKMMVKCPVGKPRRWEVIAEAFEGRHSVESVISKGKGLGKEKPEDSDSYSRFLRDRKAVEKPVVEEGEGGGGGEVTVWSSSEDIALLNALKAFPKDVAMRWEKIAAAVPGKTKNACMKRVVELKKEFRSSKAS